MVRRSVLPSWYPRTPLRDVTGVVRLAVLIYEFENGGLMLVLLDSQVKLCSLVEDCCLYSLLSIAAIFFSLCLVYDSENG
ncbi:hypothetical protein RIF29_14628 [Crotalaria pallida]|uniref:Uncharacterized protein n=1 Tax=Crotalaria pallida TaxID=3830 RepID=A0AAN9FBZ3_CROPI